MREKILWRTSFKGPLRPLARSAGSILRSSRHIIHTYSDLFKFRNVEPFQCPSFVRIVFHEDRATKHQNSFFPFIDSDGNRASCQRHYTLLPQQRYFCCSCCLIACWKRRVPWIAVDFFWIKLSSSPAHLSFLRSTLDVSVDETHKDDNVICTHKSIGGLSHHNNKPCARLYDSNDKRFSVETCPAITFATPLKELY